MSLDQIRMDTFLGESRAELLSEKGNTRGEKTKEASLSDRGEGRGLDWEGEEKTVMEESSSSALAHHEPRKSLETGGGGRQKG